MGAFGYVSRQIFGDIQETQFSGSKMQAHVHLKNTFPGGIGNRRIRFVVVGTGFWTSILSPVFWAGLSQITRFWTYRIPAAVPVFKGRVND